MSQPEQDAQGKTTGSPAKDEKPRYPREFWIGLSFLPGVLLLIFSVIFIIAGGWPKNYPSLMPRLLYIALSYLAVVAALLYGVSGFSRFAPPPRQDVPAQNNQTATP